MMNKTKHMYRYKADDGLLQAVANARSQMRQLRPRLSKACHTVKTMAFFVALQQFRTKFHEARHTVKTYTYAVSNPLVSELIKPRFLRREA